MSFAELHQKELEGMSAFVFGEKGIMNNLQELHEIVIFLGDEVHKLGTSLETVQLKEKIKENRLQANKLCIQIERELQRLQNSKRNISNSQLETTEEMERRQEIVKIVSEFQKIKSTFNQLYFTMKPLDITTSQIPTDVLLDSQMSLYQLKELQIDFDKEHTELLEELEALLSLFESLRDIVNEQSVLLDEVETNVKGSLERIDRSGEDIVQVSKYGAFVLPVLGAGIGALVGGPLGAAFGIKAGILLSGASLGVSAGVATGVGVGYYLKKKREKIESEWEWVKKK